MLLDPYGERADLLKSVACFIAARGNWRGHTKY